ncbi:MAG: DUF3810 domain-containing protein [Ichthyobacteriaceae bacterium]|nr:DUF3810 domain-containing protein [Ichthyobacteriaceae bacterium]
MKIITSIKNRSYLYKTYSLIIISLFTLVQLINFSGLLTPSIIFKYYTKGYFRISTYIQRSISSIINVSVGDILYILMVITLITLIYLLIKNTIKRNWEIVFKRISDITLLLISIWLMVSIQWNWNYKQPTMLEKMKINNDSYTDENLFEFTKVTLNKIIELKPSTNFKTINPNSNSFFDDAVLGYKKLELTNKFYSYKIHSIKYSMFSDILPAMGISGYYNPFTGEACLTKNTPILQTPFVVNHEVAHQLGIASESEANFIGYLSATHNPIVEVQYSGNLSMLLYCLSDLKRKNKSLFDEVINIMPQNIKNDINDIQSYWLSHQNDYRYITDILYDSYLKTNNQKDGLKSYNKMVSLAIIYYKNQNKF